MMTLFSISRMQKTSFVNLLQIAVLSFCVVFLPNLSLAQTTVLWQENWEGNWFQNWFVDAGTWEVGEPTSGPDSAYSPTNCAATVLAGNYAEPVDSRLIRFTSFTVPPASENPRLRFWHWYSFGNGDNGEVQISTDSGQTWAAISTSYTWSGSGTWTRPFIDLSAYADSTVQIAFDFHSIRNNCCSYDGSSGWYIDEIELVAGPVESINPNTTIGFENGIEDWDSQRGTWEVGEPSAGPGSAFSGQNCVGTLLRGNYAEPVDSRFISPLFVVPNTGQNPRLRFWHWYSFGSGDFGQVQISADGGLTWTAISTSYTWSGSGAWTRPFIDLSAYAGAAVQIAFYFHSVRNNCCSYDGSTGWYIDDFEIVTGPIESIIANTVIGFESGIGDWDSRRGAWEVGMPTSGPGSAFSGQNCVGTLLRGDYAEPVDSRFVSPSFVIPTADQNPRLRFWHWYSFGSGDNGEVQISTDSGQTWSTISTSYTWSGSGTWTRPFIDLSAYANSTVQIAFDFHSVRNNCCSYDGSSGWYIDEIELVIGPIESLVPNTPIGFESGIGDWDSRRGTWEVGAPTSGPGSSFSGQNCVGTLLRGNYAEPVDSRLISPPFVVSPVSENPRLRFWHWYSFGSGDNGEVQISTDSGQTWTVISTSYTWSGSGIWTRPFIDLSDYADSTVQIAFDFHSVRNNCCSYDGSSGWYIDEIELITGPIVFSKVEKFDFGLRDWASERGTWQVGTPTSGPDSAYSPPNCAGTVLDGIYAEPVDSRLISPPFVVPSQNPGLQFWYWYSFGSGDYGEVQISVEGGPWQSFPNRFINSSSDAWSPFYIPLNAYADSTVQIAFYFHSLRNNCCSYDGGTGWYIDDITILPIGVVIDVSPNELNFTNVSSSGTESKNVIISNPGAETLNVTAIFISGADSSKFSVDTTPFDVAPSDSKILSVTFTPNGTGNFNATLNFESNAGSRNVVLKGSVLSTIAGDADINGAVELPDAVAVLKYLVDPTTFTNPQQRANANVSPDTTVSAWDASVIMQYVNGSIATLPHSNVEVATGTITMTDIDVSNGSTIEVPLKLLNESNIFGFRGVVSYKPTDLDLQSIVWAQAFNSFSPQIYHDVTTGVIRFAGASSVANAPATFLAALNFKAKENFNGSTVVGLDTLRWNEGAVMSDVAKSTLTIITAIGDEFGDSAIPKEFVLQQNYPNPFNPVTRIRFGLPKATQVRLEVYNVLGQKVAELVNAYLPAGNHSVDFDASALNSGVYVYKIQTPEFQQIRKMLLAK